MAKKFRTGDHVEHIAPKSISRPAKYLLKAEWPDGFSGIIKMQDFRKECPCAECNKDELGNQPKIGVLQLGQIAEGQNDLEKLVPVGNYAVQAVWADGHDTGFYTFATLRKVFEEHKISDEEAQKIIDSEK